MNEVLNSAMQGQDFPARPAIPGQPWPNSLGPVRPASFGGSGPSECQHIFLYAPIIFS